MYRIEEMQLQDLSAEGNTKITAIQYCKRITITITRVYNIWWKLDF